VRKATIYVILATTLGLSVYDAVAFAVGGYEATITAVIREASMEWPLIVLAAGILGGHLFWYKKD
jgi:hypothetical protein